VVFKQALKHDMKRLIITCNPDNYPSKKTIEDLGGVLKDIVDLPVGSELYEMGDRQKCIFEVELIH
jgi:predicted acetyltransferase